MLGPIGFPELVLIFVVVLLLFGPKKLPEFAKFLGRAIREFKSTVDEAKSTIEGEFHKLEDEEIGRELRDNAEDIEKALKSTDDSGDE